MKSPKLASVAFTVVFCCTLPAAAPAMNLDEAAKASRESGRPLLILAGRNTCGNTVAVRGHLQEPALGPALANYVSIFVDVDGPEGRACEEKFGHPGDTLPFVYVVRSDGEKLYSHSGVLDSNELRQLLFDELSKAGKKLSEKETALVKKSLEAARQAKQKGNLAEAVRAVLPLKKIGPLGNINCFTGPGLDANKFVAQLTDEGKKLLEKADQQCVDGKPALDAMLTYVKARRAFTLLPTLKPELAAAARKYEHRREFAGTLAQAEALDTAQSAAAGKDVKKAVAAFERVVAKYPDTEAAKRAAGQIKKLTGESAEPPAAEPASAEDSKPAYRTWSDSSGKFSVKARLTGVDGDRVALETESGSKIRVPIEKLSDADRKFVKAQQKDD